MKKDRIYRRVYAKIDLDAIYHNMENIHGILKEGTQVMAVIKTDGYGHGAVQIAQEIEPLPYLYGFAVAIIEEGLILRRHGITKPILILGYSFSDDYEEMIEYHISPSIFSYDTAKQLSKVAVKRNQKVSIHIKLDTGMSRIGYQITEESADEIQKISKLPNLEIEGIFTHFAKADERDKTHAKGQIACYDRMIKMLKERGVSIPKKHCSNSAGIMDLPEVNMDLVRAGIILYGLLPSDEVQTERLPLEPVMELKSEIVHVKTLEAGRTISYGGTYTLKEEQRIATIPVGYGDGYPRSLSNKGWVLIHGKKAPIRGRVCMDQFMVDVTEIPEAKIGDEVTLLGRDGQECLTMEQLGELSGRFNYEFACDIGKRIPRVFCKEGRVVETKDYFKE